MIAYLLGAYQGDRHFSIDNYFQYCQREMPVYLPGWKFSSIRPGRFSETYFTDTEVPRSRAWADNFLQWPLTLRGLRGDVFHIVDQGLAWYRPFLKTGKTIITIHDLINLLTIRGRLALTPVPWRRRALINATARQLQTAHGIVCVSQNTADTVMSELSIPPDRIHVIHNIVPQVFRPVSTDERKQTRDQLLGDAEYIVLHAGKPSAYKNRVGVLRIFDIVYMEVPSARLILTCQGLTTEEEAFLSDKRWANRVSVMTPDRQEDLRLLYGASDVLVFPSLYEGFGWPPLEAMACGCPVVASSAGSLREVIGDGGITIENPHDTQEFAEVTKRLLLEPSFASQLSAAGLRRAKDFTPEKLSPLLADVYRKVAA